MANKHTPIALAWTALAFLLPLVGVAEAQQKTLYVAAYGGSFEQTMRKEVFPPFEQQHGVAIEYVAGNSTDNLARLQAQKGREQAHIVRLEFALVFPQLCDLDLGEAERGGDVALLQARLCEL